MEALGIADFLLIIKVKSMMIAPVYATYIPLYEIIIQ